MNFAGNFTKRLQESAEKAASAAANFKGFDEMADNDEYIHSPDLNVGKQKKRNQNNNSHQTVKSQNDAMNNLMNSSSDHHPEETPSWSLLDRPSRRGAEGNNVPSSAHSITSRSLSPPQQRPLSQQQLQQSSSKEATLTISTKSSQNANPWLSVVSDALEGSSVSERRTNSSVGGYDSESSSIGQNGSSTNSSEDESSSDDEADPILSQIRPSARRAKQRPKKKTRKGNEKRGKYKDNNKNDSNQEQKQRKNPHRFFQGLEEREAMANNGYPASATDFAQQKHHHVLEVESGETTNNNTDNHQMPSLGSWMMGPFRRQAENPDSVVSKAKSFLKRGPLSRREPSISQSSTTKEEEEENIQVLSSNSLLGDDEMAALAQYSQESNFTLKALCKLAWRHPREAFIVFTFVLGVVVFFYSRRKSNEDDVTR